jgi:hypothetical protein
LAAGPTVGYMMVTANSGFNVILSNVTDDRTPKTDAEAGIPGGAPKPLPEAARRALEEAAARREEYRKREAALPKEYGGRGGKEPGRYGDWEVKGLASDF